ncbi:hypothetical protein BU24DRAFT_425748 [Aaosphaeria arxii CBS 175.79]|uniref:Amidoligase enzyme n=1 Tax=Aaosphaeria arxii CBS 175.79 TaxID=1450172 RepID=A0A6A5XGD2_9PLEO|nr:uncharacterized protein BU24DRAFT_425748 [Aaosphaeria arxii CBS 175.79]KAF2011916.1 hypothetical protein BU24DRAFT_425748 [Aaosphaeria arxii CBS 175.79]
MTYSYYNFGIEIETVVRPYARRPNFTRQDWYKHLAQKLENRNVPAAPDLSLRYSAHPEYYSSKWFITKDGSLQGAHEDFVCMEIVSPVLQTNGKITSVLAEFWEAMSVGFEVQQEKTCGGHVHVTPTNAQKRFSMAELKSVAFAAVVFEDAVHSILPFTRRQNRYCVMNSKSGGGGLSQACEGGISMSLLRTVRQRLNNISTPEALYSFMQANRYVLWNFKNIVGEGCSNTLEFRGGSQFRNTATTMKWVAFVIAFIGLALKEKLVEGTDFTHISPTAPDFDAQMRTWWNKIRQSALRVKLRRFLPEDWRQMRVG